MDPLAFASLNASLLSTATFYHGDVIMAQQRWSSVTFSDPSSRQLTGDDPSLGLSGGHAETVTAKIFV